MAVININVLQAMYGKHNTFKPSALSYGFPTKAKQEEAALVQLQEIIWLLGVTITSTMVALISVRQCLQQAAIELGEDFATYIVLVLTASSFNSLSEKCRKEAVLKLWSNKSELVEMLNREYSPCLGSLFKGNV